MRKALVVLLSLLALPLLAGDTIFIRDGDSVYVDGSSSDVRELDRRYGRHYASFERNGARYVVSDEATMRVLRAAIRPQTELGERQAALGEEQARLGEQQARLGAEQAEIGSRMADEGVSRRLETRMRELGEKQRALGEEQSRLGERQSELGEQQREAAREARKAMEQIFRDALRAGKAQRVAAD